MSRGKRRKQNNHLPQNQKQNNKFVVSLDKWKRFQNFESNISCLDAQVSELRAGWLSIVGYICEQLTCDFKEFDDITNSINGVYNTVKKFGSGEQVKKKKKKKNVFYEMKNKYNRPEIKSDCVMAHIVIEDITDEYPF